MVALRTRTPIYAFNQVDQGPMGKLELFHRIITLIPRSGCLDSGLPPPRLFSMRSRLAPIIITYHIIYKCENLKYLYNLPFVISLSFATSASAFLVSNIGSISSNFLAARGWYFLELALDLWESGGKGKLRYSYVFGRKSVWNVYDGYVRVQEAPT